MYTHLDAIPHKLTQGTEPVDFACDEHLWESVSVTVERWKDLCACPAALTWKKSKDRPMFPKADGSSEQSATGTPWFMIAGNGCIGIDPVRRYDPAVSTPRSNVLSKVAYQDLVPRKSPCESLLRHREVERRRTK